jgi:hypothetical protein
MQHVMDDSHMSIDKACLLFGEEAVMAAIKDVAREKGYSYIFDTSSGALLHYPDGEDVSGLLKAKLGVTE